MRVLHLTSKEDALEELKRVGVDPYGINAMLPKMQHCVLALEGLSCKVANIMKQEMLSLGGDVAVARGTVDCSIETTDAVVMGTAKQIERFIKKIEQQPFSMNDIARQIQDSIENTSRKSFLIKTPEREISIGERTLVMGVVNMTPDSFSDGGQYGSLEEAAVCARRMEEEGADIIDVGGESTRPGSESVSSSEELQRVIPLVKALKAILHVPISVDTRKASVAKAALDEGAEIINDISALRNDVKMGKLVASSGVPIVLMHMRGTPKTMQQNDLYYRSLCGDIINFLRERIDAAQLLGIKKENIIIDPGIGFGKTAGDNLRLIKYLEEFRTIGRPILIGASRKGFIGLVAGGEPHERVEGTAATVAAAIMHGAHIIRVHDVAAMKKVAAMTDAIVRS